MDVFLLFALVLENNIAARQGLLEILDNHPDGVNPSHTSNMLSAIVNSVTNRMQRSPAMLFTRDRCSFARDGVSAENSLHHRVTHDHLGLDAIDLNSCQNTHYCHSPAGCCGIGATGVG